MDILSSLDNTLSLLDKVPKIYHSAYLHPDFYKRLINLFPVQAVQADSPPSLFSMRVFEKDFMPENMILFVGEGKDNFQFAVVEDENE